MSLRPGPLPATFHEATLELHAAPDLHGLLEAFVAGASRLASRGVSGAQLTMHREALAATLRGDDAPPLTLPPDPWPSGSEWLIIGDEIHEATSLTVPLTVRGQNVGALKVSTPAPSAAQCVDSLWQHAAVSLEKARLFDQLEHAKREWENVFDGMADGVYIYDAHGVVMRANLAFSGLLGVALRDILDHRREEIFTSLPEYLELHSERRQEDSPRDFDVHRREFRCHNPERIFVERNFALRAGDDLDPAGRARRVGILRDVTDARLLQEQVIQAEKLAALGEMLSGVAHELNNPLATVVGYAQLLSTDKTLPANLERQVRAVHQQSVRAAQMVQSLLAFSRRAAVEKERVDIDEVVAAVMEMRSLQLESDEVRVQAETAGDLPLVWGDAVSLQQVLLNVVNNAVQAIHEQSKQGNIHIRTEQAHIAGQNVVRLSVRDDGPGIPPEYLRRIFDPFFTTKAPGKGTGLGMSLAHRTIANHGGSIRAESRIGHGASFIIELPALGSGALQSPDPSDKTVQLPAPRSHVLVVDDEEPIVQLISEILQGDGHQVSKASNGAQALALMECEEFDLIISDVRMPAADGPTLFESLQKSHPEQLTKVIFVTGDTVSPSTRTFLEQAGRPVLIKPFDPDQLRRMVGENLRGM